MYLQDENAPIIVKNLQNLDELALISLQAISLTRRHR